MHSSTMSEIGEKKTPMIEARVTGPGPGRYKLPPTVGFTNHDCTRFTSPAYSFHGRLSDVMYFKDSSPGPRYFVDPQLTRFGRGGGPAYSIQSRSKVPGFKQTVPGPGVYSPEKAPVLSHERPPSYTMGTRTRHRVTDPVPAPNSYHLPSLLGSQVPSKTSTPSYSVAGRTRSGGYSEDLAQTPGPGHYNSTEPGTYKRRGPAYSMLGRHSAPARSSQTPGPGTHSPERVTATRARAPSFSMGVRHSAFMTPLIVDISY